MNLQVVAVGFAAAVAPFAVAQQHVFLGRVVAENGDAVAGAAVTARWCATPELPGLVGWTLGAADDLGCRSLVAVSDASGRFRFELPVPGPVALVARDASGALQSWRCFPVMAGGNTELRLRPADFLAGVVRDEKQQPLPGCELVLDPQRAAWALRSVTGVPVPRVRLSTDASGAFRHAIEHAWLATTMDEPSVVLLPADPKLVLSRDANVQPMPEFAALDLVATPRPLVRGVLLDAMNKAVPGGLIGEEFAPWRSVRGDAQGVFHAPVRGSSQIVVAAAGFAADVVPRNSGRYPRQLDVKLLPSRRITARLLDENEQPLVDRDVLWSTVRDEEPPLERQTRTDAQGRVVFEDAPVLATGSGFVHVDGMWRRFVRLRLSRDEDLGDVTVTWRALDGQLLDAAGVPHAGARVLACEHDAIGPLPPSWVTYTNHGGRFRFASLPRRPFTVLVDASVNGLARTAVAADDGSCTVRLDEGRSFAVTVVGDDGLPAPGAWVRLRCGDGVRDPTAPSPTMRETCLVGIADALGVVRFRGLPEFDGSLLVFHRLGGVLTTFRNSELLPPDAMTAALGPVRR